MLGKSASVEGKATHQSLDGLWRLGVPSCCASCRNLSQRKTIAPPKPSDRPAKATSNARRARRGHESDGAPYPIRKAAVSGCSDSMFDITLKYKKANILHSHVIYLITHGLCARWRHLDLPSNPIVMPLSCHDSWSRDLLTFTHQAPCLQIHTKQLRG